MSEEHDLRAPAMRTLRLAAELCGGTHALAAVLGVAEADLKAWIAGLARTPGEVFLEALDIVAAGPYGRAARHEDPASRAQKRADRLQAHADRIQASADRAQASADRAQQMADQSRMAGESQSDMEALQRIAARAKKSDSKSSAS